jgi:hypothetical protein
MVLLFTASLFIAAQLFVIGNQRLAVTLVFRVVHANVFLVLVAPFIDRVKRAILLRFLIPLLILMSY